MVILETEAEVVLELVALALVQAVQLGSTEEVAEVAAGVLEVVVELHAAQVSAEATPAMAATVATENLILIDFEVVD